MITSYDVSSLSSERQNDDLTKRSRGPRTRFAFQFRTSLSMSDDGSVFVTLPDISISAVLFDTCHCFVASDNSHTQRINNLMLSQLILCAVIEYQMDLHSCMHPANPF